MIGHGQSCCNGGQVTILLDCPIKILRISDYSDNFVYFFANQHCYSTFTKLVTPRRLTFNLTHTISYGTHVVIYTPVFAH